MATTTMVLKCTCAHEFQDATYGKGNRLHNVSQKGNVKKAYCTVCNESRRRNKADNDIAPNPGFQMKVGIKKRQVLTGVKAI